MITFSLKLIFLGFLLLSCNDANEVEPADLDPTLVSTEGLFFDGEKGVNYHFGNRITPHGSCIDVVNDYIYVTWYKGGMDKRNLMVSRRAIDGDQWKTIEFPDKHIGFRGDPTIGDSHNTAAIGISTIDQTVHLIYDMHAYSKAGYPDHFFNYRISAPGSAIVPDDEWTIDLFSEKLNYLKEGLNYERSTYPDFFRSGEGVLFTKWRFGGSGNGDNCYAYYDGTGWSDTFVFNHGDQGAPDKSYSIYGGFDYLNGKLRAGFSIRYRDFNESDLYVHNSGLFYGYAEQSDNLNSWFDASGQQVSLPLESPEPLRIGEPIDLGLGNKISSSPSFTVTENESVHFVTHVSGTNVHYYKTSSESAFNIHTGGPEGDMFSEGSFVYMVGIEDGYPLIQKTPEGTMEWTTVDHSKEGPKYRFGNAQLYKGKIYYYLMEQGNGEAQPLRLQVYDLK